MAGSRAEATAKAIEDAALRLALDRGYEGVTVDLVCEAAGVSQRTFFNHFPTKDDALLGRSRPFIDEHAARRFIVGSGPLLHEALSIIATPPTESLDALADRMRVIASSPTLLSKHLAQIGQLDDELREIVMLRLRNQHPGRDEGDRRAEAEMVSGVLGGVLRWVGQSLGQDGDGGVESTHESTMARARLVLDQVIADSRSGPVGPASGAAPRR
ncbi:TetR/AcrR family transcriptional regulator [Rothia halotolerans]|uniref:TetR/AcrR family transcriptional regulator n=1 Tax=Rothia halotolerans TaxID=405770 RepID=UPI00192D43B7|nr:TetR/AcrR family transcriptional regulator [Rothia halotolerans]